MNKTILALSMNALSFMCTITAADAIVTPTGQSFNLYITSSQIQSRVKEIAADINRSYAGKEPVILGVLKGGAIFMTDLIKEITVDCEIDFLKISSYGNEQHSSGTVKLLDNLSCSLTDRDVIVVEDIIDSGLSMNYIYELLSAYHPRSICIVTLLKKDIPNKLTVPVDHIGFHIPQEFVIGYGLDLAGKYRNLPAIYKA
jgi:hypoxanthine phosphoribosyltransferase